MALLGPQGWRGGHEAHAAHEISHPLLRLVHEFPVFLEEFLPLAHPLWSAKTFLGVSVSKNLPGCINQDVRTEGMRDYPSEVPQRKTKRTQPFPARGKHLAERLIRRKGG